MIGVAPADTERLWAREKTERESARARERESERERERERARERESEGGRERERERETWRVSALAVIGVAPAEDEGSVPSFESSSRSCMNECMYE